MKNFLLAIIQNYITRFIWAHHEFLTEEIEIAKDLKKIDHITFLWTFHFMSILE